MGPGLDEQTVCGPGYSVVFGNVNARFPSSITIDGVEVLGSGQGCRDEHGSGVALFPVLRLDGRTAPTGAPVPTASLDVVLEGPVVAQVAVAWSVSVECDNPVTVDGRATFTFFPNGRVTRAERISNPAPLSGQCTSCVGQAGGAYWLTSYTTFLADGGAMLDGAEIGPGYGAEALDGDQVVCLRTRDRAIAFGWHGASPPAQRRIRVADSTPRSLAFLHDLVRGQPMIPTAAARTATTTMMFGGGDACTALLEAVEPIARNRALLVRGTPVEPDEHGLYRATVGVSSPITIDRLGTAPGPAGAAVILDFGPTTPAGFVVSRAGTPAGDWYRIQHVAPGQVLFYFRDAIAPGSVITITPQ